ncbi:MAG TPA: sensor domain-containing diguanylate cyclase, partial [Burkholderiaceae bacterium]|nr:sensor domain-containing diguanylate cyclase [Burkholderiaceae bacterium]
MRAIIGLIHRSFEYVSLHLLRRIEIRYRLINSFILLSLLPLIISGYIAYVESINAIEEKTRIFSTEVVKQVSKNVTLRMAQIDSDSATLALSDRVQHALTQFADGNESARAAARLDLTQILIDRYGSLDYINQKYFLDRG